MTKKDFSTVLFYIKIYNLFRFVYKLFIIVLYNVYKELVRYICKVLYGLFNRKKEIGMRKE